IFLVSGQEIGKQARLAEGPGTRAAAATKNVAKELLRPSAREKVFLIGGSLVCISGRYGDAIYAERAHMVEKPRDAGRLGLVDQRAIDLDPERAVLRG